MHTASLYTRATMFALGAGAVTFLLAVLVAVPGELPPGGFLMALAPAIACAALSWATTRRNVAETAAAIDDAVRRLEAAAEGDLSADIPQTTRDRVPPLAEAMQALFGQLSTHFSRVEQLALFDTVTNLPNRPAFRARAEEMLAALPEVPIALFFIDLDRFKTVNDTRGHAVGDQLLAQVARRLRGVAEQVTAAQVLVGRLAGDEFTIMCAGLKRANAVSEVGDAIVAALGVPFDLPGGPVTISASIGIAVRPEHGDSLHDLMRAADAAMYQSKAEGRARVSRFSDRLADEIAGRERLDRELREALDRGEFALAFQPQLALGSGRLTVAEALLRWRHPQHGLRTPGEFLARAEENGQMVAIGEWIVGAAAEAAAEWHRLGYPGRIAVNISHRQLEHADFLARLCHAFLAVGAPLDRLEVELGETLLMCCPPDVEQMLGELRRAGATISLDDFGTGQSNVQRLRALPIDRIKLDTTLLRDVEHDPAARAILQALIGLIHGLGCEAVAEGVETQGQMDVLRVLGCDAIQGYAIARPMELDALSQWMQMLGMAQTGASARRMTSA